MENRVVGFAARLLDGPSSVVGTITSGGTESVLLAVQGARDSPSDLDRPRVVLPVTAHPAFHKAAHYFGVEPVMVDVDDEFRARPTAMRAAMDDRTMLVVASAPSYAHGVVDPVTEIGATTAERGARCHVDACIGGWVLPYAARLGRPVRPWRFAVEGVTSTSVDLHEYAYAPRAPRSCCTGHRSCDVRSSSPAPSGPATRCSTRRCSRPSGVARLRARGRW